MTSLKLSEALQRSQGTLPEEFAEGRFCQDYEFRCQASARTWGRPHAQDNLMCDPLWTCRTPARSDCRAATCTLNNGFKAAKSDT